MRRLPGTDTHAFLALARKWASTVTVVTIVRTPEHIAQGLPPHDGFTATAFLTLSLKPPIILVSASNETTTAAMLRESPHFAVNLLSREQKAAAASFAIPHTERADLWTQVAWSQDAAGVPLLTDSLGAFSARRSSLIEAGDHTLVLGEVTEIHAGVDGEPLIYGNRSYGRLGPL